MTGRPARGAVLDVVHVITTLTTGGAERQLELLLSRSRHRAGVIALYEGGPVADRLRAAGRPVQILRMDGWRKPLAHLRLARMLRRLHPEVVHVHLLSAQLWGIPAARLARVPVIVSTEHSLMSGTIEGRPHSRWLRRLYLILARMSSHSIAVSATTAARLRQWGVAAQRITVIDNGIDFAELRFREPDRLAVRAELGIGPDCVVIGAIGRLEPVKRLDAVLRAAAPRLRAGGHVLLVAGTGTLAADLVAEAGRLGVADAVRWFGARGDVPRLLSAMDVLVSASRDETFGMAVVEALGSGLPVVFAQCPAVQELAAVPPWAHQVPAGEDPAGDDPAGEDPAREPAALGAALDAALAGGQRRYPVPAELLERYGIERTAEALEAVYERLVHS